jgi:hypothetical protein
MLTVVKTSVSFLSFVQAFQRYDGKVSWSVSANDCRKCSLCSSVICMQYFNVCRPALLETVEIELESSGSAGGQMVTQQRIMLYNVEKGLGIS